MVSLFPRLIGRGLIEAIGDLSHVGRTFLFPRLIGRGLIEAIWLFCEFRAICGFPRLIGRGLIEAISRLVGRIALVNFRD